MADGRVYGLLGLAGVDVALPLSALREVVPHPSVLAALPVTAPGLVGAMELRDLVVPVVDLRFVLGAATGASVGARPDGAMDQVVVVVADGDQLLGLVADEVRGVLRVPDEQLLALRAGGGSLLVSHTFRHLDGSGIVSVLDAAALVGLPGVPTVQELPRAAAATGVGARGARRTLTLLRCGPQVVALDVRHVHTTLPGGTVVPSVLDGDLCLGVAPCTGREVPVVDPLVMLGLGALAPEHRDGAGLVLDLGDGYVVLALTALLDIVQVDADQVLALPPFSVPRPELLTGMVDLPGVGQCLVLDGDAWRNAPQLLALAALNTAVGGSGSTSRASAVPAPSAAVDAVTPATPREGRPYLTYAAGAEVATPLEQVSEILPLPTTHTPTSAGAGGPDGVVGLLAHRGSALPLVHLPTVLGVTGAAPSAASCVLLVEVDGAHVGFAVDALHDIEPLRWEDPEADRENRPPGVAGALHASPLVQVGDDPRLLRDLDLRSLARAVRDARGAGTGAGSAELLPLGEAQLA